MIFPMFGIVLLTLAIGSFALYVRIKSVTSGRVKIKYYRTMTGQEVPEIITKSIRCFNNMFEIPVLFYVVSVMFVCLKIESNLALWLAWAFVGFRLMHTLIHLTYNNVLHRMLAFWAGIFMVLGLWIVLLAEFI
jgi:hypothetical protein